MRVWLRDSISKTKLKEALKKVVNIKFGPQQVCMYSHTCAPIHMQTHVHVHCMFAYWSLAHAWGKRCSAMERSLEVFGGILGRDYCSFHGAPVSSCKCEMFCKSGQIDPSPHTGCLSCHEISLIWRQSYHTYLPLGPHRAKSLLVLCPWTMS